jgi:hypothetical protein
VEERRQVASPMERISEASSPVSYWCGSSQLGEIPKIIPANRKHRNLVMAGTPCAESMAAYDSEAG